MELKPYYQEQGVTIYHGDNREVMPALDDGSMDLVLTSPNYNLGNASAGGRKPMGHYAANARPFGARGATSGHTKWKGGGLGRGYGACDDQMPHEEYVAQQHAFLRECWRLVSTTGAIYYNHKPRILGGEVVLPTEYNPGLPLRQVVIWDRGGAINFRPDSYAQAQEWLMILARPAFRLRDRGASGVKDIWPITPEVNTPHPAPFPLALAVRALETTKRGRVLDPYAGWGTTLVAAKLLGREAIGIELEERFCELAANRLRQEVLPVVEAVPEMVPLFE
jgi:site-specific DNA-methyltransferase (adenine-specific)